MSTPRSFSKRRILSLWFLGTVIGASATAQDELYLVTQNVPVYSFGRHMDVLGDVDGDGINDYVVAGLGVHVVQPYSVQVHSGRDGALLHSITRPANTGLGHGLAGIGDVTGDGVPDYAVADPWMDQVQVRSGSNGQQVYKMQFPTPGMFGAFLSGLGDVDGDTIPDYVIACPGQIDPGDGDPNEPGFVRVVGGATGNTIWQVTGAEWSYAFGVGSADVNGDGVKDVLAGAPEAGLVDVLEGATGNTLYTLNKPRLFGRDLAGVGDVDGDGGEDFLVGSPSQVNWNRPGRAFLYSGRTGQRLFRWEGAVGDDFGWNVAAAGDVNGDGVTDCLVGMGIAGPSMASILSSDDGSLLYEWNSPSRHGHDVAGLGDVDGDGRDEVLIGDVTYGGGNGAVHVYRGRSLYLRASPRKPAVGQSVTLNAGRVTAGTPLLLVIEDISGNPCWCPVFGLQSAGPDGFLRVPVPVTASLAGLSFTLQALALDPVQGVLDSAPEIVTVQ